MMIFFHVQLNDRKAIFFRNENSKEYFQNKYFKLAILKFQV